MDIDKARQLKMRMDRAIATLCNDYYEATNLRVSSISILSAHRTIGDTDTKIAVSTEIRLP